MIEEPRTKLWTWHSPDFSITDGRVEHNRSKYLTHPDLRGLRPAYRKLAQHLGTDQIIWCYVRPNEHFHAPSLREIEWELEVPRDQILGIIDTYVWNKIAGIRCHPPESHRLSWEEEAIEAYPHDDGARAKHREELETAYYAPIPEEELWKALFLDMIDAEGATAVIRHPVPEEYVKAKHEHGPKPKR